jgi:16S rRNA processing protein RimM
MDKIKVGIIVNTHGLKGELKIKSLSDFNDERFKKGNELILLFQNKETVLKVKTYREHKDMVLVTFDGFEDINKVEIWKGSELYIDRDNIEELEEGYYFFELKGCSVYDQDDNLLGEVEDVIDTAANPILRINKTILVPYVDQFIKNVDIENKRIDIEVIEGLL